MDAWESPGTLVPVFVSRGQTRGRTYCSYCDGAVFSSLQHYGGNLTYSLLSNCSNSHINLPLASWQDSCKRLSSADKSQVRIPPENPIKFSDSLPRHETLANSLAHVHDTALSELWSWQTTSAKNYSSTPCGRQPSPDLPAIDLLARVQECVGSVLECRETEVRDTGRETWRGV